MMIYKEKNDIDLTALTQLYNDVGWLSYTKSKQIMEKLLPNSLWWCGCYIDDELAGMIRVVGDGVSIIYVQDLLISPKYQRRGIGSQLLKKVMERYIMVRQIVLVTDDSENTKSFYEAIGFSKIGAMSQVAFIRYNNG